MGGYKHLNLYKKPPWLNERRLVYFCFDILRFIAAYVLLSG